VFSDRLCKLRPDELCSAFEESAPIPPHIDTLSWSVSEPRRAKQLLDGSGVELPLRKPRNRRESDAFGKDISTMETPEPSECPVVNVKRQKPVGQARVVNAVPRVAPLAEKNQVRTQSICERTPMSLEPSRKRLELRMR
jgi:hypothetical protein